MSRRAVERIAEICVCVRAAPKRSETFSTSFQIKVYPFIIMQGSDAACLRGKITSHSPQAHAMSVSLYQLTMIDRVLSVWLDEAQGYGIKSAWHDIPIAVIGDFAAFEVGNVGIFEIAPNDAAAVHLSKVISC